MHSRHIGHKIAHENPISDGELYLEKTYYTHGFITRYDEEFLTTSYDAIFRRKH